MTVHHMIDYRPAPHTAANNVYPPDAQMIEWVDCDDCTDDHIDLVPDRDDDGGEMTVATMLITIGVLASGLLAYAFVPVPV